MREGRGVWRLRGWPFEIKREQLFYLVKIYDGPFYLFFFTLDAGFTLNIPKMITDQLRRDNLSWIETHKTTDCLFRSHSQFFCTFFLPMVPDTYTGILTRAVRVWNSSFRLWRKMWITLLWLFIRTKSSRVGRDVAVSCKKSTTVLVFKRLHIGMCDYLHWFFLSCTCTYLTLAPCFFCCCCCFFFFFSNLHRVQLLLVTSI